MMPVRTRIIIIFRGIISLMHACSFCSLYFLFKHYLAGNMQLIKIWGDDHGPWMQALHCVFGVGALLGPLVATPFLSPTDEVTVMDLLRVVELIIIRKTTKGNLQLPLIYNNPHC